MARWTVEIGEGPMETLRGERRQSWARDPECYRGHVLGCSQVETVLGLTRKCFFSETEVSFEGGAELGGFWEVLGKFESSQQTIEWSVSRSAKDLDIRSSPDAIYSEKGRKLHTLCLWMRLVAENVKSADFAVTGN